MNRNRTLTVAGAGALAHIKVRPPPAVTDQSDGGQPEDIIPREISGDHSAIQFATVQLFVVVYLQKFAVGPLSFQISLPILIMLGHVGLMLVTGRMQFAPLRLGCYLLFAASCLLSQAVSGAPFSIPSTAELLLIYGFLTVTSYVSESAYQLVLRRFIGLMII